MDIVENDGFYSEVSGLNHVLNFLNQERENIILEANTTMAEDNEAAKIAIGKLLIITEVIRMIETLLQTSQ